MSQQPDKSFRKVEDLINPVQRVIVKTKTNSKVIYQNNLKNQLKNHRSGMPFRDRAGNYSSSL